MKNGADEIPPSASAGGTGGFPWTMVLGLALATLVSWGTLFYAFAILMLPMGAELGWSKPEMNGALSLGLGITGLSSYAVGRWIDRRGGRMVMVTGGVLGALFLLAWSQVTALWELYAVWVGIGVASAMVLYDPVFAVLARAIPGHYRRAITLVTLLGGLASTVFIPLTQELVGLLGWRQALIALALIELPVSAGLPWLLLHDRSGPKAPLPIAVEPHGVVRRALRHPTFWLLAASFVGMALFQTAVLFSFVPMLAERGFGMAESVFAYALIGPTQVAGRVVLLALERRATPLLAGLAGTVLPLCAMLALSAVEANSTVLFLFAAAFGAGMGIKTIVQATAAPELLGRSGYGALQGAMLTPVYAAHAIGPFAAALLWQVAGDYRLLELMLILVAAGAALAFVLAVIVAPKRPHQP